VTAGSPDPDTLHRGELDLLLTDLVEAGFRATSGDRHNWIGPVPRSLRRLTAAAEMRIEIRDGWPYLHPYIHVDGLGVRKHVNPNGNACLWFEDDDDYGQWLRLDRILTRVDSWVADQEAGAAGPALDTHLYFPLRVPGLLTFDLDELVKRRQIEPRAGASGELRVDRSGPLFALGGRGGLSAAWFWQNGLLAPPSNSGGMRELLSRDQRRLFDRITRSVTRSRPAVMLLLWDDGGEINALGVKAERASPGYYVLGALEVARTDAVVMRLRAGSDAERLDGCRVVLFGAGAIGSATGLVLAQSGLGALALVDNDRLRPANLTRHAASGRFVGYGKAEAVAKTIAEKGLRTRVDVVDSIVWEPSLVRGMVERGHLVIDTTGNSAYTDMVSRLCGDGDRPLISAALHRGGRVLRVRVQMSPSAAPIWNRSDRTGFPDVTADPAPQAVQTWEVGCGAPVNNAPPVSVADAGARAARAAIDVLSGRETRDVDLIDVFEGIEGGRFATRGSFEIEAPR
jgi:hypothetical protein